MKPHPIIIIITGMLICSIGLNILQHESNKRLCTKLNEKVRIIIIYPKPKSDIITHESTWNKWQRICMELK